MKVTIKEVAKAAGVSIATASMAINNKKGVNAATREMVLETAKKLSYVPNFSARSLVTKESNTIGLLVPEIVNPYYSSVVDILTKITEQKGYTLLLGISNNKPQVEKNYVASFLERRVMGVIVIPMLAQHPDISHLNMLRSENVPMVFCTDTYDGCIEPCVMCDFQKGEYEMTRHLLEKGHKHICFVSVKLDVNFASDRLMGYIKALQDFDIAVDDEDLFFLDIPRYNDAYNIADQVLARKPDAIVCINDMMTLGLMKRMIEVGIHIPEDMAIAGYDDMMFAELAQKPLTTVRQPLEEICSKTFRILEQEMKNGSIGKFRKKQDVSYIKPTIVLRETT